MGLCARWCEMPAVVNNTGLHMQTHTYTCVVLATHRDVNKENPGFTLFASCPLGGQFITTMAQRAVISMKVELLLRNMGPWFDMSRLLKLNKNLKTYGDGGSENAKGLVVKFFSAIVP